MHRPCSPPLLHDQLALVSEQGRQVGCLVLQESDIDVAKGAEATNVYKVGKEVDRVLRGVDRVHGACGHVEHFPSFEDALPDRYTKGHAFRVTEQAHLQGS